MLLFHCVKFVFGNIKCFGLGLVKANKNEKEAFFVCVYLNMCMYEYLNMFEFVNVLVYAGGSMLVDKEKILYIIGKNELQAALLQQLFSRRAQKTHWPVFAKPTPLDFWKRVSHRCKWHWRFGLLSFWWRSNNTSTNVSETLGSRANNDVDEKASSLNSSYFNPNQRPILSHKAQ